MAHDSEYFRRRAAAAAVAPEAEPAEEIPLAVAD